MTHRPDVACSRELAARWCALAERRLDHLTELFQSGRWRRYYTEQSLLDDIRHAKAAIQTWRSLSLAETQPVVVVARREPEVVLLAPIAPTAWMPPPSIKPRPIELQPSIETVLAESEIIVHAEFQLAEDEFDPDMPIEEDIEADLTIDAPRIDMTALAQALSVGIASDAEDDEPLVDLDAIERRYPALAVAF